jgi:homoserine/homoserine lactone efflux protein
MLLAMTTGAKRGVLSAFPAALGNVLASVVQVLVSIAMISAIAHSVDALFRIMMAVGGLYLIYLGVNLLRSNPFKFSASADELRPRGYSKDFIDVFLITFLNPKAIMFFVALFPQVIPRGHYSVSLVAAMTVAFAIIALLCFIIYAIFGTAIRRLASSSTFADIVNATLSAIFVGIGVLAVFNAARGG